MLKLTRRSEFLTDSMREYEIFIDGRPSGTILDGNTVEIPLEAGNHTIEMMFCGCRSKNIDFFIADPEENVEFECFPNTNPLTGLIYIILRRNDYINLMMKKEYRF